MDDINANTKAGQQNSLWLGRPGMMLNNRKNRTDYFSIVEMCQFSFMFFSHELPPPPAKKRVFALGFSPLIYVALT